MPHVKLYLFFLLFLGFTIRSRAQSDSVVLQNAQDTARLSSPGVKSVSDTGKHFHRTARIKKTDTSVSMRILSRPDSLPAAASSQVLEGVPVRPVTTASPGEGDMPALFRSVLQMNPFFNFYGKAVAEEMRWHNPDSKDLIFYLLTGILFYFALIRIFFEKYFDNLLTLFFRVSIRQQQIREQVLQTPLPSLLLNILFVISGGLYASCLVRYYHFAGEINFWILLVNCMGVLGVIYLGKFLLLKFCGWVFNISRATDIYIFVVFLVNKMMGIFLLPILVILFFSGQETRDVFITISLSMVFIFFMYRVIASFRPVRNEIKLTPFHFFLYLCAFEIAPLLLIYKVLLTYLEKAY